ncbi:MAG: hypothetical protein M3N38_04965 [Pseudomonadota bacterium]|nr:hypothetical protein [Pseudomonadota bacterium]
MNKSIWLTRFLGIAGVLESLTALALLASPSRVASILLQSPLDAPAEVVGRIAGAGLLSLGIACWLSRKTPLTPAGLGVAWALLAYNFIACVTLACAGAAMASGGIPALGASVLHGLFGVVLLATLIRPHGTELK